jgi:hypothetical protein
MCCNTKALSSHPSKTVLCVCVCVCVCVCARARTVSAAFVIESNEADQTAMSRTAFANQITIHKIYGRVSLFRIL